MFAATECHQGSKCIQSKSDATLDVEVHLEDI